MKLIRNVLLVIADQWRGDSIACWGHPDVKTPHLDAFAAEAMSFQRHHAQAAPCGPSRASLLTGLYLMNHRQVSNETPLPASIPTLAHLVSDSGRSPVLFGYTDTPNDPDKRTQLQPWVCPGFETRTGFFYHDGFGAWRDWLQENGVEIELGDDPESIFLPKGGYDPAAPDAPCQYPAEFSDTAFMFGAARDYISEMGDQPWFVNLNCLRPHPPMVAPEPYNQLLDPANLSIPARHQSPTQVADSHPFLAASLSAYGAKRYFRHDLAPDEVTDIHDRTMRAAYYGNMAEVDDKFGALIAELKANGQYDDTLIIFTSDHADQLGDNWIYGRRGPFPGLFHVPLMIRDPRHPVSHGTQSSEFTETIDVLPTIADAIGQPTPQCDGHSLSGFLQGNPPANWREHTVWEADFRELRLNLDLAHLLPEQVDDCCFSALMSRDWLYIHFPAQPALLYDLNADPHCQCNLAEDPVHAADLATCAQALLSHRIKHTPKQLSDYWLPYATSGKAQKIWNTGGDAC
ncbi:sulfatase-like hydrolase/transferase [Rhodobacteraceae bacterium B1Z28]|uniref:Sulfatase-like hydrolase/transferase n=1 Tax=Ruegeria haliotis TaxID=2747601 RepID=A0ABX2PYH9_9RHOB|nr:sulfatase-like hydrolase/transferase [Ruegeria haliotis]NVO58597.1 sulfatase-like hydrolase/transferase [Ruegeria haliotis]